MFLSSMAVRKIQESSPRRALSALSLMAIALAVCAPDSALADAPVTAQAAESKAINVLPGELTVALKALASQLGVDVVYVNRQLEGMKTRGLSGNFATREAFEKLLEGTPLVVKEEGGSVMVRLPRNTADASAEDTDRELWLAQAEGSGTSEPPEPEGTAQGRGEKEEIAQLEEVVVTGTHIRGRQETAAPTYVFTRDDIDTAGFGSVKQFIESLPQNIPNVTEITPTSTGAGIGLTADNRVGGSGANLRGLGPESTLVLINGRRAPPGNYLGNFVDISMIPLAALERVEIVPDGASAIYGSDAVGGVINFILRRDFEGSETRARYGSVTRGARREIQVGQTLGGAWAAGSALLSYEYNETSALDAEDRSFSDTAAEPFKLLPEQDRHGLFATLEHRLTSGFAVFADASYAKRRMNSSFSFLGSPIVTQSQTADTESYSATAGVRGNVWRSMALEMTATYASGESRRRTVESGTGLAADMVGKPKTLLVDALVNGSLWSTPAGPIRYAVGAQYRREQFELEDLLAQTRFDESRNVLAEFLEVRIPLIGAADERSSDTRLELVLADRNEHYNDFGSANNPQAGLIWKPIPDIKATATVGRSFRAPALNDLNGAPNFASPIALSDPALGTQSCFPFSADNTCTHTLYVSGGNEDLGPEKARTWTAGIALEPRQWPGFNAHLTYYDIEYDQRIASPEASVPLFDFFLFESALGPGVVRRSPSDEVIQDLVTRAGPAFQDFFGMGLSTITAIADARLHNLSSVRTDGVDFGLSYQFESRLGQLRAALDGTKIRTFDTQFVPSFPQLSVLDTPYNPIDLRMRAHSSLKRGDATFALSVNYADSYENNAGGNSVPISSWTTVDIGLGYDIAEQRGVLSNLSLHLGATNVFDKDPPLVVNPNQPIDFDGANASPLGRFLYLQLSKRL